MNPFDENTVDNVETWACQEANRAGRKWGCKVADFGGELEIQFIGTPEIRPIKIPSAWFVEKHPVELRRHIEELVRAAIPR
jgi:hypothetical protein